MAHSINTTPLLQEYDSDNEEVIENNEKIENKALFVPQIPKDQYYMAFIIFYLLGMVTLLPWNFFITADDYWMYKFREINGTHGLQRSPLQASFTSYISVASALPSLIFLILNTALSNKISVHIRIISSLIFMLILFIITLVFVTINTDKWQDTFFVLTVVTIVLLNVCSAILCGSIFGIVGLFSPIYITATIGGQALGGIFTAITEIISLSIGASSVHSAFVYFLIGTLTILLSIVSYVVLMKMYFFKYYLYEKPILTQNEYERESIVRPRLISYKSVIKKIYIYAITMFSVFIITLSVYPSVTVLIESEGKGHGNKWNDVFFVPTIAYLLFSIGDYLGRILAGRIQKPRNDYTLLILSISRFVFIPLLMLCNAQPRYHWAVVFNKDYQYIIILFLFALTNGYLANLTAIFSPKVVDSHEKEMASSITTIFMGFGLAFGSIISVFTVKLL